MLWYSGFLPYHNEMVEINDNTHFKNHTSTFIRHQTDKLNMLVFDGMYSIDLFRSIDDDMVQCKLIENMDSEDDKRKSGWIQYLENVLKFIDAPYVKYLYNLVCYFIRSQSKSRVSIILVFSCYIFNIIFICDIM